MFLRKRFGLIVLIIVLALGIGIGIAAASLAKLSLLKVVPDTNAPIPSPTLENQACGGFVGETGKFACPVGYMCKYPEPMYPDAQGVCVKQ